ncbi:hypothetical protein A165_05955 [Vibrio tasmaniensis ZS-17]|uniref:restriction endonuclease subunit S n=1 Tax=Vibrio tasmaniensis TaxID=212663 RepID=UPI000517A4AE|nr:restriction endonuclease subunit S [Vibrio tasmaniensis]OED67260.1 hypothetical protein A165_05955 [Vibrio tasmaniensis ZS-17]
MNSTFRKLGELIELTDEKNKDGSISNLLGINIEKNFMPSVANVIGTDLSKYRVIRSGYFACNIMHVGRDERLPVALYKNDSPSIVSPAYKTFKVADESVVLSDYLMMFFQRKEFDRLTWYYCDSSIRGGLDWDRFCEIEVPIPSIDEQKKYVKSYTSLVDKQQAYAKSLAGLKQICDSFVEYQILKRQKEKLAPYIVQSETKNSDLSISYLRGISTSKKLIPSKANTKGVDFSKYRIVEPTEFAYVADTSRRGDKIALAMNQEDRTCIVSAIYTVFSVKENVGLLPEYLYLWFSRSEFDRYARYHSWGSARETFDWADMCNVELPIPSLEEQKAIVAIHRVLEERKEINEKLKTLIQPLCPAMAQGVKLELESKKKVKNVQ